MFFMIFGFGLQYVTKNIVPGVDLKKIGFKFFYACTYMRKSAFFQKNAKKCILTKIMHPHALPETFKT